MPADYHTHTPLCQHAEGGPEQFVDRALELGLSEYGISDHAPQRPEPFDDWRMLESDLPAYFAWIHAARRHAAGRIPVRCGLECDWLDGCEPWIAHLATLNDWDYLIGSVHYLGSWDFDNPHRTDIWENHDLEQVWTDYWQTYTAMADSGLFDLLAHPDLVKKFGHRPSGDLTRFYAPAIDAIAAAGCAIEINTAGLHKPAAETYPAPAFIELAASAGIPLAISSDAHAPAELGRDFPHAIKLARSAGYRETVLFDKRRRRSEPLP